VHSRDGVAGLYTAPNGNTDGLLATPHR